MTRRYYVPELPRSGGVVSLDEHEAAHALRVMRVQRGQAVTLFDGRGWETEARVVKCGRRECLCEAEPGRQVDREPQHSLTLGVALPKTDRAREMVERLAELGVQALVPILTDRSQRVPSPALLARLRRAVIESCKQSGRNMLMRIGEPTRWEALTTPDNKGPSWILDPSGQPQRELRGDALPALALVGPEGGWTEHELSAAMAEGLMPVSLGRRIYRVETAAVALAARILD